MSPAEPTYVAGELAVDLGEGLTALASSGLLWALNQYLLHGEGVEIRVQGDRVFLVGDGKTVRQWEEAHLEAATERRIAYKQAIQDAKVRNNPRHWKGNSDGFGKSRPVDMAARARAGR